MKKQGQLYVLTVVIAFWLTACGSSPLVRPETEHLGTSESVLVGISQSPIPTPTPTQRPQSIPPPVPTVIAIPPQDVVTTDTLEPGLKIVYSEIATLSEETSETNIWMSNVIKLDKRKLLTKIGPHKQGYWPGGIIAPDSKKLLYSLTPVNLSGGEAHKGQREIWILDIGSGKQAKLLEIVSGFVKWLPDSQTIMYSQNEYDDMGGVKSQIYLMSITDRHETPIFSTSGWGFSSLSFLDKQTLLYLDWKSDMLTEVRTLDLSSGQTKLLQAIDVPRPWDSYSISPDNSSLLVTRLIPEKEYELVSILLSTGEKKTILTAPYNPEVDTHPIYRLDARWLPDSQNLSIHFPPQADQPAHLSLVDAAGKTPPQFILADSTFLAQGSEANKTDGFLLPGLWSPEGQWLTLAQYPRVGQEVYVLGLAVDTMTRIPTTNPSFGIGVVGWVE